MTPIPQYKKLSWIIPGLVLAAAVSASIYEARETPSPAPMMRLAVLALVGLISWLAIDRWGRLVPPAWSVSAALVAVVLYAVWEWRAEVIPLLVLHHFVVAVAVCKLLQKKEPKDFGQLVLLTLLLLTLGGVISPSLWFVAAVVIFVTFGVHALITLHLERERVAVQDAWREAGLTVKASTPFQDPRRTSHRRATLLAGAGMMGASLIVFLAFPRVRLDTFAHFAAGVVAQTGFTPDIRFDGNAIISESERPVCRVTIRRNGELMGSPSVQPYFRLSTQDSYGMLGSSGIYGWTSDTGERLKYVRASPARTQLLLAPDGAIPQLEQTYLAESLPKRQKIFHIYPAMALSSDRLTRNIHYSSDGTLRADGVPSRGTIEYTVYSLDPEVLRTKMAPRALLENRNRSRRQLPSRDREGAVRDVSPRIRNVAQRVREVAQRLKSEAGDAADHAAVADAIKDYLMSGEFTYTLERIDVNPGVEPVEDLLFVSKKGHCEYFATAMTVLCQLADVPARIVAGYRGGDFNATGSFYQVREKDAHAWVEVYLEDHGWTTYDPTPADDDAAGGPASLWSRITSSAEYLQYLWVSNVVAFDTEDQTSLWQKLDRWIKERRSAEGPRLRSVWANVRSLAFGPPDLTAAQRGTFWLAIALAGLWAYFVVRLMRLLGRRVLRLPARLRRSGYTGFYRRVLRALARRGHHQAADQTPREFAHRVAEAVPAYGRIGPVTEVFYATRFGGRVLSAKEVELIEQFLKALD